MTLEFRPNCEWCDRDLPPIATDAMICSYECTYCAHCVETVLHNVCATCGGGLVPRPIRPSQAHRPDLRLGRDHHPAGTTRKRSRWSPEEVDDLSRKLREVPPEAR